MHETYAMPSLLRGLFLLLVLIVLPLAAAASDEGKVGFVDKAQNEAQVISSGNSLTAVIGTPVRMKDELRTGDNGRLQVTFLDDTVLTLGANASIIIDSYVFDPEDGVGNTVFQATKGAFRFATGRIKNLKQASIAVSTPFADIGVRGTEFWGGVLDGKFGVLLLQGEVSVSNQAGRVTLSAPGQGTDIPSPLDPPGAPSVWPADKVARAVATVALH